MRFAFVALGLCLVVAQAAAFAPHPSILTVKYKDHMWPVVNYGIEQCIAIVDGQPKTLWRAPGYALQSAPGYGDNYVEADGRLGGPLAIQKLGGPHLNSLPDELFLRITFTAKKDLKDGFAVVGLYSPAKLQDPALPIDAPALIIQGLLRMPAGQPTEIKFELGVLNPPPDPHFFVLIFDDAGREVMTNGVQYAWEYFTLCERARLKSAIKRYLEKFPNADHDAVPAIKPKPILPSGVVPPKEAVTAILTVTDAGWVSEVDIQGSEDSAFTQSVTSALEGWLFLPKLKAGQPVPVRIAIPLKF